VLCAAWAAFQGGEAVQDGDPDLKLGKLAVEGEWL
jgi:hypothetical protein